MYYLQQDMILEILMNQRKIDLNKQRGRLLDHLAYYGEVLSRRDAAYNRLKLQLIIPRIQVALRKIDDGTYQLCSDCAECIPNKRLELIPGALRCISCQTLSEAVRRR